jgi:hypothetical protein
MNKEEVQKIVNDHNDSFPQIIKAHHREFYDEICKNFRGEKFGEKIYRWLNIENVNLGKCERCKNDTKFLSIFSGFRPYCSKKCSNLSTIGERSKKLTHEVPDPKFWVEKPCELCGKMFWSFIKRDGRFCSNDCSAKFYANNIDRLSKIRETKLERYGSETFVNPEKAKKTCLEKYGVDNVSKSQEVIDKIKQVNLEKYGVEWNWQSEIVKDKIKKVNLERYGVENPSSSEEIKEKRKKTFLKKYGVENPFQCSKIKEDIKKSYIEKFGVEYPIQIEEVKKKIMETSRKTNYRLLCNSPKVLENIDILFTEEEYKGASSEFIYKVKCKKCGNIFEDHFDAYDHPRCLICYPIVAGFSYAEKEITSFIKSILPTENIIEKDRSVLENRELDIYIPSKNLAIEYDGLFWHSEIGGNKNKTYHLDKLERCLQKGIKLITIFEDEWKNNLEIVKSKLNHIIKSPNDKIYARKCDIQEIETMHANIFLDKYHIQGRYISSVNIGLFFNNELVAVMTFGKMRISLGSKNIKDNEYELLRYATSKSVVGGASKLLSYFVKIYKPERIISYADRRWSIGNLYEKIGFKFIDYTKPNYWYLKLRYSLRYHRYGFRKDVLKDKLDIFDPQLTEWENMQLNGYDRIWDCGNIKYEWLKS